MGVVRPVGEGNVGGGLEPHSVNYGPRGGSLGVFDLRNSAGKQYIHPSFRVGMRAIDSLILV